MKSGFIVFFLGSLFCLTAHGADEVAGQQPNAAQPTTSKVKYKAGKDMNFEELLIEGAVKRPELSVITGDSDQDTNGLLRLRENFIDRMTVDASEEIP